MLSSEMNDARFGLIVFILPSKTGSILGSPRGMRASGRPSVRRPVLCLEHISKTILATVMKFCGWIDLIMGECSAHEPKLLPA